MNDLTDADRMRMILELNNVMVQQLERGLRSAYEQKEMLAAIDRLAKGIGDDGQRTVTTEAAPPF